MKCSSLKDRFLPPPDCVRESDCYLYDDDLILKKASKGVLFSRLIYKAQA
jgi:hypothetical protein